MIDEASGLEPKPFSMLAVGSSTAVLGVGLMIGQVFGVIRSLFVAGTVGTSASFDAALVAIVVPTVLGNSISNTLRIVLVPAYRRVTYTSGANSARRLVGTLLMYLMIISVLAVLVVIMFPDVAVTVSGPGLGASAHALAVEYVPVIAPMLAFLAIANVLTALFQLSQSYVAVAISWACGPIASLVITVASWNYFGMLAYVAGTTVGSLVTLVVLVVAGVRNGIIPRPTFIGDRAELQWFGRRALPQTVASGILQLNLISDRAVATLLSTGAASALKFGQQIVTEPAAALSSSWTTAIYPAVVDAGGQEANPSLGAAMTTALKYTVGVFVPVAVGTIALAPLVVDIVYGRGAFTPQDVVVTSTVVAAFAPTLLLNMAQPVFSGAHNARHRGSLMAVIGIANAILNVVLNVAFGAYLGVAGIALSTSVTMAILIMVLAWRIPHEEAFRGGEVLNAAARALIASLVPGVPIGIIAWFALAGRPFAYEFLGFVVLSLAAIAIYLGMSKLLRLNEPLVIASVLRTSVVTRSLRLARSFRRAR